MSTASLDFADRRIGAQRGIGVLHLTLSLRCHAMPGPVSAEVPYQLSGNVHLDTGNASHYLTRCVSSRPFWFRDGRAADLTACLDITPDQLEEIEALRSGGDLTWRVDFVVTAIADGVAPQAVLDGAQARLWVQATTWSDVLVQAGDAERVLLVVPAPPETASQGLREAWKAWRTARQALDGGRWADAVAATRKVFELLGMKGDPKTGPQQRTKDERWQSVGSALFRLASAPNHADEVTLAMDWTRHDAAAAVAAAGALLRASLPWTRP